jgi:hypothetical protein
MPFDNFHNLKFAVALAYAAAQSTDQTGTAIDVSDFRNVVFDVHVTAASALDADNYFTLDVQESPDNVTWTSLYDSDEGKRRLQTPGLGTEYSAVKLTAALQAKQIGARVGTSKYMRLRLIKTGTVGAGLVAHAILCTPRDAPVSGT